MVKSGVVFLDTLDFGMICKVLILLCLVFWYVGCIVMSRFKQLKTYQNGKIKHYKRKG